MNNLCQAVVGFMFSEEKTQVALIRKIRPSFHNGMLNGIGGHIDYPEMPLAAMIREFQEETGVTWYRWELFLNLRSIRTGWEMHVFRTFVPYSLLSNVKTMTDEDVSVYKVRYLNTFRTVPNLPWMIPLAINTDILTAGVVDVEGDLPASHPPPELEAVLPAALPEVADPEVAKEPDNKAHGEWPGNVPHNNLG